MIFYPDPPPDPPKPVPPPAQPTTPPAPMSNDTITYTRVLPTLGNTTITTKINENYPSISYQDANSLDIVVEDNYATPAGGGGVGTIHLDHNVNKRTGGGESIHHGVNLRSTLESGFNISHSQITQTKRLNGGDSSSIWFNNWGPNSNYATTPDADGVVHLWNTGSCRIGELNNGNAWGDFGMCVRGISPRWCGGLEIFPDWLSGNTGSQKEHHYHASWAYGVGGAGLDSYGNSPKNWIGYIVFANGIVGKNDHKNILPGGVAGNTVGGGGYGWEINGSTDTTNPIGKGINIKYSMDVGIDYSEAKFTTAAMQLADDQPIKLGSVWLRGHQGHLQRSMDGVVWVNLA